MDGSSVKRKVVGDQGHRSNICEFLIPSLDPLNTRTIREGISSLTRTKDINGHDASRNELIRQNCQTCWDGSV